MQKLQNVFSKLDDTHSFAWRKVLLFIVVIYIQLIIVPLLFSQIAFIDVVTPLLVFMFLRLSWTRSFLYAMTAAFILETHSSAPAGFYFSLYLAIGGVCVLVKPFFSWNALTPWVICFALAETCMVLFYQLYKWVVYDQVLVFNNANYHQYVLQIIFSIFVGVYFYKSNNDLEKFRG